MTTIVSEHAITAAPAMTIPVDDVERSATGLTLLIAAGATVTLAWIAAIALGTAFAIDRVVTLILG